MTENEVIAQSNWGCALLIALAFICVTIYGCLDLWLSHRH